MDDFKISIITDNNGIVKRSLPGATPGNALEYPSDWFVHNPRSKPPVSVSCEVMDKSVWDRMLGHALTDTISPNVAVRFVYEFEMEWFPYTLLYDWVS